MLQLTLLSDSSSAGRAEMYIDYQDGLIGFTVTHGQYQHDFNVEENEWDVIIKFIQVQKESKSENKLNKQ